MNLAPYKLPNGCVLETGGRVRMKAEQIWEIPEADVREYDIRLDNTPAVGGQGGYTHGSEVVWRPAAEKVNADE